MKPPTSAEGRSSIDGDRGRPDLLLIVMDCVRASDFCSGSPTLEGMPGCTQLARDSTQFVRAVAPASWTIPSHASLFTGLYPWEHGMHARGAPQFPSGLAHLAAELRRAGYRTGSFSANPFVSDATGLATEFDSASWGGWWERYARHVGGGAPPGGRAPGPGPKGPFDRVRRSNLWPILRSASRASLRHPLGFQAANRLFHLADHREGECPACVAPWLESTLETWMADQPPTVPRFVFVNLMEAHEPYVVPEGKGSWAEFWRSATLRQDFGEWLEGEWAPDGAERATLRRLYTRAIQALDHRIERILRIFKDSGRWDSTVVVLTSDHGQGLGEEGMLSHGMNVADSVSRVPLWLRLPGDDARGRKTTHWASLTDVAPTFAELARLPGSRLPTTPGLLPLLQRPRPDPVWSMSEGVIWKDARAHLDAGQLARYDRVLLAGFYGETKVVYDAATGRTRTQRLFGPDRDPRAPHEAENDVLAAMIGFMEQAGAAIQGPDHASTASQMYNLESWGYA